MGTSDSTILRLKKGFWVFVLIALVTVLLAEITLRIYNPIPVPLRANQIVLPVRNHFVYENINNPKADPIVETTFNNLGFRGPDKPEFLEEYTSVITVGGSTTACVALTDGKTWPDRLAVKLQSPVLELWLNNAGLDGHSTFGHTYLLRQVLADLKPDFILYLVGVNEIGREDLNDDDAEIMTEDMSLRNRIVAASELLSTLQVLSRTMRAIQLEANHVSDLDFAKLESINISEEQSKSMLALHREKFLPGYYRRLELLIDETIAAGIQPILATQPAAYGDVRDPTLDIDLGLLRVNDFANAKTQWMLLESYNSVTKDVAQAKSVPLIDLALIMPKDTRYYFDWIHYSNEGAEIIAELVAAELGPVLINLRKDLSNENPG